MGFKVWDPPATVYLLPAPRIQYVGYRETHEILGVTQRVHSFRRMLEYCIPQHTTEYRDWVHVGFRAFALGFIASTPPWAVDQIYPFSKHSFYHSCNMEGISVRIPDRMSACVGKLTLKNESIGSTALCRRMKGVLRS